jgi:hypothetical protein
VAQFVPIGDHTADAINDPGWRQDSSSQIDLSYDFGQPKKTDE